MKSIIWAALLSMSLVAPAHATDCKSIIDTAARLACYDAAAKKPASAKKPAHAKDEFGPAKQAMERKLTDPGSAQFRDMFKVNTARGEIVCGMVNSKNRMGGYVGFTGFIYEPRLQRATKMFSGGQDPGYTGQAAAAYCNYCAGAANGDHSILPHCESLVKAYGG